MTRTADAAELRSRFRHTVSYLRKMGIPANGSIQVRGLSTSSSPAVSPSFTCEQAELGSADGRGFSLRSEFGGQRAGLRLVLRGVQVSREIRGSVWHSWAWLRRRGLPHSVEVTSRRR